MRSKWEAPRYKVELAFNSYVYNILYEKVKVDNWNLGAV